MPILQEIMEWRETDGSVRRIKAIWVASLRMRHGNRKLKNVSICELSIPDWDDVRCSDFEMGECLGKFEKQEEYL